MLIIVITGLSSNLTLNAQSFADKTYYLIDSLDLSQLSKEDSLLVESSLKEYYNAKDDTSKINIVSQIVEEGVDDAMWYGYNRWVYNFVEQKLNTKYQKYLEHHLKNAFARASNYIGFEYCNQGYMKEGLVFFFRSLEIQEEIYDSLGMAKSLNNIGFVNKKQGRVLEALEFYHRSLKIEEEIGSQYGVATSLNNIGLIYIDQGSVEVGLDYYNKSLKIRQEIGDREGEATVYNNIGIVYDEQGNFTDALTYFEKSLEILEEFGKRKKIAGSLINIGGVYESKADDVKAMEYYKKGYGVSIEIGDKRAEAISLTNIGKLNLQNGNVEESLINGVEGLRLGQEMGLPDIIKGASGHLYKVFKKQGKGLKALEMYKLHIEMKDSLNNEATQKATAQQQAKYEYEKQKAIDDAEHDKLLAIEQEAKAKQKVITIAIGVGLVLVVLFLIFVFNRLQVTKKQKLVIEEQRDEVEEAHKEIRDSINYAERIQRSFLATDELLNNNLKDYFVFFQPKDVVSGDFYWAGKLANDQFAVVNADSTGHGVPGAIMSILNISSIEKAIDNKLVKPADIFNHTRETIIERLSKDGSEDGGKDGMDASIIAFDNNKFSYTAAQNPIWVIRGEELIEIKPEKMPIGKHDNDFVPFVGGEFETQKGDVIYTLTDGFQDQFGGEKNKKFKVRPFKNYLISIAHLPMQEQKEKLNETFTNWRGEEEQVDDVCIIGVRI